MDAFNIQIDYRSGSMDTVDDSVSHTPETEDEINPQRKLYVRC